MSKTIVKFSVNFEVELIGTAGKNINVYDAYTLKDHTCNGTISAIENKCLQHIANEIIEEFYDREGDEYLDVGIIHVESN